MKTNNDAELAELVIATYRNQSIRTLGTSFKRFPGSLDGVVKQGETQTPTQSALVCREPSHNTNTTIHTTLYGNLLGSNTKPTGETCSGVMFVNICFTVKRTARTAPLVG